MKEIRLGNPYPDGRYHRLGYGPYDIKWSKLPLQLVFDFYLVEKLIASTCSINCNSFQFKFQIRNEKNSHLILKPAKYSTFSLSEQSVEYLDEGSEFKV